MAVIGVSVTNDRHPANVIYNKNLHRYPVWVFPVNPRGGLLQGTKVFSRVSEIPEKIDMAVIAARAEYVPDILTDCIDSGVRAAAVISGGFAESGRNDLEERLVAIAREADFPFIGPNCLGIYSPGQADTFFLPGERMVQPHRGNIALVSQSGGILVDLLRDTAFRLHPLTDVDAADMLESLKGIVLLRGYRGQPPADERAAVDVLLRISTLIECCPSIRELDINPLKVLPRGALALDVRVRVSARTPPRTDRRISY